jgi:trans-aconitate methyltransferase
LALSGESKTYFADGRITWLERWLAEHSVPRPRRIVDFGCGVGDVTVRLADRFPEAETVGLDISADCIERACRERAEPRVRFALAREYAAGGRRQADLLHCNGVLHHVPPDQQAGVMMQLTSLVRSGGHVFIFDNNPFNPGSHWVMRRIPFDRDAKMITPRRMRRLLTRSQADVCDTVFLFFFPRCLRALRVVEPRLTRVPLGAQYGLVARVRKPSRRAPGNGGATC